MIYKNTNLCVVKYSYETKLKTAKLKGTHLYGTGFQVDTALGCANLGNLSESIVITDLPIFKLSSRILYCPYDKATSQCLEYYCEIRISVSWNFCEIVMELLN